MEFFFVSQKIITEDFLTNICSKVFGLKKGYHEFFFQLLLVWEKLNSTKICFGTSYMLKSFAF